jgi:hypothetical protein
MEGVKNHVLKMIQLVSRDERRKNPAVGLILFKIERLLLWANESANTDTKFKNFQGRIPNGK